MVVRTRFAPSPTGVLHLGSVRTALFCWLYARHHDGKYVLRIEDTDRERSSAENVQAILDGLDWLGIEADEGPFYQTRRFDRYREVLDDWLASGKAYRCYCSREELAEMRERQIEAGEKARYDGRCRDGRTPRRGVDPVLRFRNPASGDVVVPDLIRGEVRFRNEELDDLIICRSDGTPTYNFTVVVDDADMAITHVVRGDDHLNNTPRQMNMFAALGAEPPAFAHLPMILGHDGSKLSKRHGAVDIRQYREQGYLPEAMLNYLVRLGWSHGDREIFSISEMIELFDLADVNQAASTFNPEKLLWINQQHIIHSPADSLGRALIPFLKRLGFDVRSGPAADRIADAYRERAVTLLEMAEKSRYCFEDFDHIDEKAAKKTLRPSILGALRAARQELAALPAWQAADIAECVQRTAENCGIGLGKVGQPLRVAVTGGSVSPPIDVTLALVGRDRSLQRIDDALAWIEKRSSETA